MIAMMGRSHLVIGTGVTLSLLSITHQEITLPVVGVAILSSILPDIDEPNSLLVTKAIPTRLLRLLQLLLVALAAYILVKGNSFAPWNILLSVPVAIILFMPTRTLRNICMLIIGICIALFLSSISPWNLIIGSTLIVCSLLPHRGLTHSIYGLLAWTVMLFCATYTYGNSIWIAGGISYTLHLLTDSITNRGIRPIPPFKFRLKLNLMSTGTWKGNIVENICIGLTILLVWITFFHGTNIITFFKEWYL